MQAELVGLLVLAVAATGALAGARNQYSIGFRGDGSGVFADAEPAVQWREPEHGSSEADENILWKTPLPNWGHGSPIAVAGRVLVMCEPGWTSDAPLLVCVDEESGQILWQRTVDPFDLLPPERAETARRLRRREYAADRKAHRCYHRWRDAPEQRKEEIRRRAAEAGVRLGEKQDPRSLDPRKQPAGRRELYRRLRKEFDFYHTTWRYWGLHIGHTFPTPVSDGEAVYVVTAQNAVACFDLGGRCRWLRRFQHIRREHARESWPDVYFASSPLVVGEVLVVRAGKHVRGLDTRTGQVLWCHWVSRKRGSNTAGTPLHLRLDTPGAGAESTDVVVVPRGIIFRASDGKVLCENLGSDVRGMAHHSMAVDRRTNTVFFGNGGHSGTGKEAFHAVRLEMTAPDTVVGRSVWSTREARCENHSPVYHDGLLYLSQGMILDAETGRRLGRARLRTVNVLTVAGDYLFTLSKNGESCVYSLGPNPKRLARNRLRPAPIEGRKRRQHIARLATDAPSKGHGWVFTLSGPFFRGERMFIRSNDFLYCIGEP